jgi:hypothetical protein
MRRCLPRAELGPACVLLGSCPAVIGDDALDELRVPEEDPQGEGRRKEGAIGSGVDSPHDRLCKYLHIGVLSGR